MGKIKMEINKDTWHYQLVRDYKRFSVIPTNLCPYCRALIAAMWKKGANWVYLIGGGLLILACITLFVTLMFGVWSLDLDVPTTVGALMFLMSICGAVACAIIVVLLIMIAWALIEEKTGIFTLIGMKFAGMIESILAKRRQRRNAKRRAKYEREEAKKKGDVGFWGVIHQWLKAVHDGVCPNIEFVESEDE